MLNYPIFNINSEHLNFYYRNQEHLEQLKKSIADKQAEENDFLQASNRSKSVLISIKLTIIDLIQKLQEIFVSNGSMEMETNENAPNHVILEVSREIGDSPLVGS